jgi:NAD(P)H-dependent flavin oxidoreductase YrpB (nitropropane dioxygenase family)
VEAARKAVGDGVDLIIAQGSEAGGHNFSSLPTFVLVPEIVEAVKGQVGAEGGKVCLVLAAGGITTGRQVAAALCLGADGVWVGTRMVASAEAFAHVDYKARLLKANGIDTHLDSTFGPEWPFFNPMRLLANEHTRTFHGKEDLIPANTKEEPVIGKANFMGKEFTLRRFTTFLPVPGTEADMEWMPLLAGQGVGMVREIRPAGEIVEEMMREAAEVIRGLKG